MNKKIILIVLAMFAMCTAYAAECGFSKCQFCASSCCSGSYVCQESLPSQPAGSLNSSKAAEIIRQVNAERAKYGLGAVTESTSLTLAANIRAKEIADTFSHTRPDGSNWSTVSSKAYAENIARGYKTADKVMAAWLTSDGHRKNILNGKYTSIGVAVYEENGILHWVQLFGKN